MTDQVESPIDGLRARFQARRRKMHALRRRGALLALGLVGLAYDHTRTRLAAANDWLDHIATRGAQAEQDLDAARKSVQESIEEKVSEVQVRGEAMQAEARTAVRKFVTPPPSVQEDIPVTAEPDSASTQSPAPA